MSTFEIDPRECAPQRIVSFKINAYDLARLDNLAKKLGFNNRSEFIRCALILVLEREDLHKELVKLARKVSSNVSMSLVR